MDRSHTRRPRRLVPAFLALLTVGLPLAQAVAAASLTQAVSAAPRTVAAAVPGPSTAPAAGDRVRLTATPLLGGSVRPGSWTAVRVHVENDGPAIDGELRVSGGQDLGSSYGLAVQLATGARQDHLIYAQPAWFGEGLAVSLVAGSRTIVRQPLSTTTLAFDSPTVVVVAERPESFLGDLRAGTSTAGFTPPTIMALDPSELPPRAEAWSAIDRLVWQDADSSRLDSGQLDALRTWVGAGGRLVVLGGSAGLTGVEGLPAELLPFVPSGTADASPDELVQLLGPLPPGASSAPVLAGTLERGSVLGRTGDSVYAAQHAVGQGMVTVVGMDPGLPWLRGTAAAQALWRRLLPPTGYQVVHPLSIADDGQIVASLNNLPAVALPDIGVLLALLAIYIAVVGPLQYLVLRRLDRREWAWFTIPALVAVFTVGAYAVGMGLKGTDIIVNQIGIVRGATGSARGLGHYYVGVFSPTRATYELRLDRGALITTPAYLAQQGTGTVPLDVLQGDLARVRGYQVGFGVLRAFRAEAPVDVPLLEADLVFRDGRLSGTIVNASEVDLDHLAVTWGGGLAMVPSLAAGEEVRVSLDVSGRGADGNPLSQRMFGALTAGGEDGRRDYTRRALIDQLTSYTDTIGGYGAAPATPYVLAWAAEQGLGVELGAEAQHEALTLYVLPTSARTEGELVYPGSLMRHSVVASEADQALDNGANFELGRGSMVVEFRPAGFGGEMTTSDLFLRLDQGDRRPLAGRGTDIEPLPDEQQPPQDDPLAGLASADEPGADVPTAPPGDQDALPLDPDAVVSNAPEASGVADAARPPAARMREVVGDGPLVFDDQAAAGDLDGLPAVQLFDRLGGRWLELPDLQPGQEYRLLEAQRYVDGSGAFLVRFVNRAERGMTQWFSFMPRLEGAST